MPTIYKDWLYSIVRHALTIGGGMLIRNGYASSDTITPELIAGLASAIVGVLWSLYQKYRAKQVQFTGQAATHAVTEDSVKKWMDTTNAPSVFTPPNAVPVMAGSK